MMDNCGQILNVLNEYMTLRMVVIMWLDRLLGERFVPFQHQRTKEPWLDPISSLRSPKRMAARSQRSCTNATTAVQTVTTAMMALDFIIADPERTECKKCKTKCLHDSTGHKSSQICLMLLEIKKKSTPSSQNFVPRLWKHHVLPERIFAPYLWPNFDHFHGDVGESAAEPRKTSGKKALHWKESQDVTGINPRHQPWLCGRWVQLQPSFATWSTFASDITWPKQSKCTRLINHIQL